MYIQPCLIPASHKEEGLASWLQWFTAMRPSELGLWRSKASAKDCLSARLAPFMMTPQSRGRIAWDILSAIFIVPHLHFPKSSSSLLFFAQIFSLFSRQGSTRET